MINTESGKTYLIDWEFANISEPSQDVAKIIYENVVLRNKVVKIDCVDRAIKKYCSKIKIANFNNIRNRVLTFIFIIAIEDIASRNENELSFKSYSEEAIKKLNQIYDKI